MTATSAHSANETPSTANPFLRDLVASLRTVQLPGSPATYANRAALRELGLRWDPAGHRWHGTTTAAAVKTLREQLHLEVGVFGALEGAPTLRSVRPRPPTGPRGPPRDYLQTNPSGSSHPRSFVPGTCTRLEPRLAFPVPDGDTEEIPTETRRFSLWDITSGLRDDSREADEKAAERQLRDLRGRVKAARAVVSRTPGLAEALAGGWEKAAQFYARFGISEAQFRAGVPVGLRETLLSRIEPELVSVRV